MDAGRAHSVSENPSGVTMLEAAAQQGQRSCDGRTHWWVWRHGCLPARGPGRMLLVRSAWAALVLSSCK